MDKRLVVHTNTGDDVVFDSADLTCRFEAHRREDHSLEVWIVIYDHNGNVRSFPVRHFPPNEAQSFEEFPHQPPTEPRTQPAP